MKISQRGVCGRLGFSLGAWLAAIVALLLAAVPPRAQNMCCDSVNDDRLCFDDAVTAGQRTGAQTFEPGSCAKDCSCGITCDSSATLVAGYGLSHWALQLRSICCGKIKSTSGGSSPGTSCANDPRTNATGIKYETSGGVHDCGSGFASFTVEITGAQDIGCVEVATRAGAGKDTATAATTTAGRTRATTTPTATGPMTEATPATAMVMESTTGYVAFQSNDHVRCGLARGDQKLNRG